MKPPMSTAALHARNGVLGIDTATLVGLPARVARLERSGALAPNWAAGFTAALNANGAGIAVGFTVADAANIARVALRRNLSRDPGGATEIQHWFAPIADGQAFHYVDADATLAGKTCSYWLIATSGEDTVEIGPQTVTYGAAVAAAVTDFDVSLEPGYANVSFSGTGLGSLRVTAAGYLGHSGPTVVGQGSQSPFRFPMEDTGEAVTFTAVAVGPDGKATPSALTRALTLAASSTVPAKLMGVTAAAVEGGVEIAWRPGAEQSVTGFRVLRAPLNAGSAAASQIATVAAAGAASYSYTDTAGLGDCWEWYVEATNTVGNGAASAAATVAVRGSGQLPQNLPVNVTNNATLHPYDAGGTAGVEIYGPGGAGTSYSRTLGGTSGTRPAGSITGLAYQTAYAIYYDGAAYHASAGYAATLPDTYELVGQCKTPSQTGAAGGSGAAATANLSGTNLAGVSVTAGGAGYINPSATLAPNPNGAILTVYASGGVVTSIGVSGNASGFSAAPTVTITDNPSTGTAGGGGNAATIQGSRYALVLTL